MVKSKTKSEKPNWTLLHEVTNDKIDKLFEIYAEDKERARIYFHLNKTDLTRRRTVLFEYPNGNFRIVMMEKRFGISINAKMYISEKTLESISYTKDGGFHHFNNRFKSPHIQQLTYLSLINFVNLSDDHLKSDTKTAIMDYMTKKFGWIRYIGETMFWGITFNVIVRKKLFNLKAMLRHVYGCPYPQAKFVDMYTKDSVGKYLKVWKEIRKHIINVENLNEEFFKNPLYQDSCRMGQMVGKKVNCSWSVKRLKTEHDNWAKLITQVLIDTEPIRDLKILDVYKKFSKYSGFELLRTNHALLEEGQRMNHCVGTYSPSVDAGTCAIYRVDECTLELRVGSFYDVEDKICKGKLTIGQFMDFGNTAAPTKSRERVTKIIDAFSGDVYIDILVDDCLPF